MPQVRANNIDIEYESFGRDSDPVVLLIMGFSGQLTLWPASFCDGLAAQGYRVIRFDNRDVGKSTHLAHLGAPDIAGLMAAVMSGGEATAPYALDDMAADAAGLLEALSISGAHIVGASMGGMIAQVFAINHPAKTKSLVSIMSTTGRRDLPPARPEAMAALMTPPASSSREHRIAAAMHTWRTIGSPGYPATEAELRAGAERDIDRAPYDPAGIARQMAAIVAAAPRNEKLKAVVAPTLVIHGMDDPLVPMEGGKDTAAAIPGAELALIPGMAHDFTDALAPVYLERIGGFLKKLSSERSMVAE